MVSTRPLLWHALTPSATMPSMETRDSYYDDLRQLDTDFADATEVATCDDRQNNLARKPDLQ